MEYSLNFLRLITETALHESDNGTSLSEYYKKCMDMAYEEGVPKHHVSKTVLSMLDDEFYRIMKEKNENITRKEARINRSQYFLVSSRSDYSDPNQKRNTKEFDPSTDQENSSIYTDRNAGLVNFTKLIKESCNIIIQKLKDENTEDIESKFSEKEIKEFLDQQNALITSMTAVFDEKTKVEKSSENVLLDLLISEASVGHAASLYMRHRLEKTEKIRNFLSKKQALKYQKTNAASQLHILQPHDRDTALMLDCVGQQCPKCRSWKTRVTEDDRHMAVCIDCEAKFGIRTIPKCMYCFKLWYAEDLKEIISTGKCTNANCQREIDLPKSILENVTA